MRSHEFKNKFKKFILTKLLTKNPGILKALLLDPYPIRSYLIGQISRLEVGSYEERLKLGAVERPHYGYCVYNAAANAKKLGYKKISFLELGVASGNGLINLEYHATEASKLLSIDIEVYGFDLGSGLPKPLDYRDYPYH